MLHVYYYNVITTLYCRGIGGILIWSHNKNVSNKLCNVTMCRILNGLTPSNHGTSSKFHHRVYKFHPQSFLVCILSSDFFSQFANIVIVYNAFCSNNYIERRTFRTSIVITAGIKPGRSYSCFVRALTHISTTSTTTVSVVTDDISK